jgi:hypothetical protein
MKALRMQGDVSSVSKNVWESENVMFGKSVG